VDYSTSCDQYHSETLWRLTTKMHTSVTPVEKCSLLKKRWLPTCIDWNLWGKTRVKCNYTPGRDSVKYHDTRVVRSVRDTPGLWRHGVSKLRPGEYKGNQRLDSHILPTS